MISDYLPLYPYILLTVLGIGTALLDAFMPRRRLPFLGWLAAAGTLLALALDWAAPPTLMWGGMVVFDGFSRVFDTVFLSALTLICVGSAGGEGRMRFAGEYYALLIFSTMGLMLVAASGGLLTLYLGIELSTICLFALAGFEKRERRSAEASLKLFVLGAVASAIILYGASIVYGVVISAGSATSGTQYDAISSALISMNGQYAAALWLGLAFVAAGIVFKIAAAPFHLWAPDVYEGAPAGVSAYLSTASKAGGFAALMRLLAALTAMEDRWVPALVALSALSMVVGNLVALRQTNLKRLLAYSGIAQAGYILVALTAGTSSDLATGSILMYLLLYVFANVGGFLVAQAVRDATGSDDITALRGLHRRSPPLAFAMLVILFSLGGIPPLAGFVGKLYLFAAGWEGGQYGLILVAVLTSVISLYYYLMVALQVYIRDPADDRKLRTAPPLSAAIAACVIAVLAIGIYPGPWVRLGATAATAIRGAPIHPATAAATRLLRTT